MTQEDKELLLKDLCARVPYGVKILDMPANAVGNLFLVSATGTVEYEPVDETNNDTGRQTLYNIKPYLRPMSSMTEEEKKECLKITFVEATDWLNVHHFDYRGLIPMGLALEAPAGMYENITIIAENY